MFVINFIFKRNLRNILLSHQNNIMMKTRNSCVLKNRGKQSLANASYFVITNFLFVVPLAVINIQV